MAKNNPFAATCAELLVRIRERHPLIHHITNFVVMNDTANLTLALGALLVALCQWSRDVVALARLRASESTTTAVCDQAELNQR